MKVLVLGSGAREHSICWSLANSTLLTKLYCAPGNPGISKEAECIDIDINNNDEVVKFSKKTKKNGQVSELIRGVVDFSFTSFLLCVENFYVYGFTFKIISAPCNKIMIGCS